jgi:hypothetical protein
MASTSFDTLRCARRLKEVGVPEQQADVQAELMAEAIGFYAENLPIRDNSTRALSARFSEQDSRIQQRLAEQGSNLQQLFREQDASIGSRFAIQDTKIDTKFIAQGTKLESRFSKLDSNQAVHTLLLGLMTLTLVVPKLIEWFS